VPATEAMNAQRLEAFFAHVAALKRLPRTGWVQRGVPDPESVAAHSFGVAALAAVTASAVGADPARAVLVAVIHDVAEALTGDLTPADGVPGDTKRRREEQAARRILAGVDPNGTLMAAWLDYAERRTPEGRLVKDLDKIDMALQADAYAREGTAAAGALRRSAERTIQTAEARALLPPAERA
jgi:putative hydrolase of HD superfamily